MRKHFIKHIELNNFKCFDHFQTSGFKRVNLLGGKNNIGKTTLLEALYFSTQSSGQFIAANFHVFAKRNAASHTFKSSIEVADHYIKQLQQTNAYEIFSNNGSLAFKKKADTIPAYLLGVKNTFFSNDQATTKIIFDDHSLRSMLDIKMNENLPSFLLFPFHASSNDLKHFYQTIQEADNEDEVSDYLRQFDADITRFKIFSDQSIKLKKSGRYQDLNTFGDGLKSYIAIILALYSCKNGYLFIDE